MSHNISGVLPVVHTPFLDDESIDYESLPRQIDWAFAQGAHGYCTGMVSELLRLTTEERIELTEALAEMNAGRGVFIAGVGAENTRQAMEYAQAAEDSGSDRDIQNIVDTVNRSLPDYARILRWRRLIGPLTATSGLYTANGRPNRPNIARHYARTIDSLYMEATPA